MERPTIKRYIGVVYVNKAADGKSTVESYDFQGSSLDVATSRTRLTALQRWDNPEAFIVLGVTEVARDASEDAVTKAVEGVCERW